MAKSSAAQAARTPATRRAAQTAAEPQPLAQGIDTDLVRAIAALLTETNVGEIEVRKGDLKIRVARHGGSPAPAQAAPAGYATQPQSTAPPAAAPVQAATPADLAQHPGAVQSPMVGTAFRKPSPEAKNFVEVGSTVKAGDKLMLIEAMKTFNDIVAPKAGLVSAVMVEDGQPVEFGQTLFVIE